MEVLVSDCKMLRNDLVGFIEESLDADVSKRLREHVSQCESCRQLVSEFSGVWSSVDRTEIQPSEHFWTRLEAHLDDVDSETGSVSGWNRGWSVLRPIAVALAVAVATFMGYSYALTAAGVSGSGTERTDILESYGIESLAQLPSGSAAAVYIELEDNTPSDGGDES
jgi:hypothetical protein